MALRTCSDQRRQRLLDRTAMAQAVGNGARLQPRALRPLRQSERVPLKRYHAILPRIARLRGAIRPTAIVRAIGAVIVQALKGGVHRRAWPHIRQEVVKRCQPAVADHNATSAVPGIRGIEVIGAALFHVAPERPLRRDMAFLRHAVCRPMTLGDFRAPAATTDTAAIAQGHPIDRFLCPAIAQTQPFRVCLAAQDGPSSKTPSSDIYQIWHTSSLVRNNRNVNE